MAKKPPGAKKRGPTMGKSWDEWSNHPKAVMHRIKNARPVVGCRAEYVEEVMWAAREVLNDGEWDPPLPTNFSLFMDEDEDGNAFIRAYGLSDGQRSTVSWELEKHPEAEKWGVWDAMTDWAGRPA